MDCYQIVWRIKARQQLIRHLKTALDEFGSTTVERWLQNIKDMEIRLQEYPRSYTLVQELRHLPKEYRGHTIMKNFKIIYSFSESEKKVCIEAIWDLRMNPTKLEKQFST